jgi:hypothetical protein
VVIEVMLPEGVSDLLPLPAIEKCLADHGAVLLGFKVDPEDESQPGDPGVSG